MEHDQAAARGDTRGFAERPAGRVAARCHRRCRRRRQHSGARAGRDRSGGSNDRARSSAPGARNRAASVDPQASAPAHQDRRARRSASRDLRRHAGALSRFARAGRHHRRPHPSRPPARSASLVFRALAHEHWMVERSLRRDHAARRLARLAASVELQGGSSADPRCRRRIGRLDWRGSCGRRPGHRGGDRGRSGPRHGGERTEDRRLVDGGRSAAGDPSPRELGCGCDRRPIPHGRRDPRRAGGCVRDGRGRG